MLCAAVVVVARLSWREFVPPVVVSVRVGVCSVARLAAAARSYNNGRRL